MTFLLTSTLAHAQTTPPADGHAPPPALSGGDKILGGYGPYRANNDLLHYNLHVRVDPAKQFLSGTNAIQFRMLEDGNRIQARPRADLPYRWDLAAKMPTVRRPP